VSESTEFWRDLVVADRTIHVEQDAAGVLTDGLRFVFRQRDVLIHDFERVLREGIFLLILQRREDGLVDVVGNLGRRAADQFDQGIQQFTHKYSLSVGVSAGSVNATPMRSLRLPISDNAPVLAAKKKVRRAGSLT
jgi:hypothetical protein